MQTAIDAIKMNNRTISCMGIRYTYSEIIERTRVAAITQNEIAKSTKKSNITQILVQVL